MTVFLVIVLIIGNLFLFSGAVFGDLADNQIAWFFVIGAVAMDIYFIYLAAQSISKNREQQRIAEENSRIAETTRKVETIISKYTPASININRNAIPFNIDPNLINREVVYTVNSYREKIEAICERYLHIATDIKKILLCVGCNSIDDKLSHLTTNKEKLKQLKDECDSLLATLSSYKVEIINENRDLLFELKLAFRYLLNSKKCHSDSLTVKEFITPNKPADLKMFKFENEPITIFGGHFYFCLFSNVILVFDNTGAFSTAVDPSSLIIETSRETTFVSIINGTAASNQYIAEDSKCISQGPPRLTWLHTCRDGSPDLRYSDNPRLEYRNALYEYSMIKFVISDNTLSFSASSSAVCESFETIASKYTRKCNDRHNPIPELLQLVNKLSGDDNIHIESIIRECNARGDVNNYFCKLIEP